MESFGDQEAVIPHYFICPISLHVMKDPVTAATGITYDRDSVERWLATGNTTCPVTNQPLSSNPAVCLTPNHTLRRLIQSWRALPPTPAPACELDAPPLANILCELSASRPPLEALHAAAVLASESDTARRRMMQSGVAGHAIRLIISCAKDTNQSFPVMERCLSLLQSLKAAPDELQPLVASNHDLVNALKCMLLHAPASSGATRTNAVLLLKSIAEVADAALLERLKPELFPAITAIIHDRISVPVTKAALQALLSACPRGRNRARIAEAGAVHEAVELELDMVASDRRMTELVMALLDNLCACAEGRAAMVAHPAGIAMVAKRILRVSPAVDACAVRALAAVGGRAAAPDVVAEMARVGAVAKLCFVLQADCATSMKEKARGVLRWHSGVWKTSPCLSAYLLTRYP